MSALSEAHATSGKFFKALEIACKDQGVEYLDAMLRYMTQHGIGKHGEADRLFRELAWVLTQGSFRVVYSNLPVRPNLTLSVVAPLAGLKITFAEAAALAREQFWQMLPFVNEPDTIEVLRRNLVPYRIVHLTCPDDGMYSIWRLDRNVRGRVDGNEHFGPQDVIVLTA